MTNLQKEERLWVPGNIVMLPANNLSRWPELFMVVLEVAVGESMFGASSLCYTNCFHIKGIMQDGTVWNIVQCEPPDTKWRRYE